MTVRRQILKFLRYLRMETPRSNSAFRIFGVIAGYWTVSISMVFANKYLVGTKVSKDDLAIFVAWIQCVFTVLLALFTIKFRTFFMKQSLEMPPLNRDILLNKNMLIMFFAFTGMLVFNNYCLKYVGIAFFQVSRSLSLIFTVIGSILILKQKVSCRIFGCCFLVFFGFSLGVDQEKVAGSLSVLGVIFGVISSLFISLNGIFIKRVLEITNNNSLWNVFYMNLGASALMLPLVVFSGQLFIFISWNYVTPTFFSMLFITALLGFAISFMGTLVIEITSPTTHHISNNTKSVFQTLLAVIVYQEYKTWLWWLSNIIVISAALLYTYIRNKEMASEKLTIQVDNQGSESSSNNPA